MYQMSFPQLSSGRSPNSAATLQLRGGNVGLTVLALAELTGISKNTYPRAENGNPRVILGVYAMALFVLGFGGPLATLVDVSRDDTSLLLDEERLPKRVLMKKAWAPRS